MNKRALVGISFIGWLLVLGFGAHSKWSRSFGRYGQGHAVVDTAVFIAIYLVATMMAYGGVREMCKGGRSNPKS